MTVLALDRKAEISIEPETYYYICELAKKMNWTPAGYIEYLINNHPDVHDMQVLDRVVWICSCGLKTRYSEEVREHLEDFPDHTCTKCLEF